MLSHLNDVQGLVNGRLLVEGESRVDLSRHLARDNAQDFLAEQNEEIVKGSINLLICALAMLLAVDDRFVDQLLILGLLGRGENQRWVCGGILRLIFANGGKVTRVSNNRL